MRSRFGFPLAASALLASLVLASSATAVAPASTAVAPTACARTADNRVTNCDFAKGIGGWRARAATAVTWERRLGHRGAGALRMVNEPASEAGAVSCATVTGGRPHELSGMLRRVAGGPGVCMAILSEHDTPDCSGGTTHFHEMPSTAVGRGAFTSVGGAAELAGETTSVTVGFACYGEQDDVIGEVLLDEVVLRPVTP